MWLEQQFLNNPLQDWLIAIGAALIIVILLRIIRGILSYRIGKIASKTETQVDDLVVELIRRTTLFFLLILALFIGANFLTFSEKVEAIIVKIFVLTPMLQTAIWGLGVINFFTERLKTQRMEKDAASATTFSALGFLAKIILWSVILLMALDNLGIDITAMVAGLGIGGIAIALAVQNVLGDLLASLSIVLDKPFVLGDFIIVDNHLGAVEHIGLKTTRIRSLSGEQLIFSNNDLLSSRIRNFKRMAERRVVFSLGVIYQTRPEKLEKIPTMIETIIKSKELTRFDRAHFRNFGDFSLNFEVVFWIGSPDYNLYMDIQQAINLEIYRQFEQEGIEFAYPTQTLYVEKASGE